MFTSKSVAWQRESSCWLIKNNLLKNMHVIALSEYHSMDIWLCKFIWIKKIKAIKMECNKIICALWKQHQIYGSTSLAWVGPTVTPQIISLTFQQQESYIKYNFWNFFVAFKYSCSSVCQASIGCKCCLATCF